MSTTATPFRFTAAWKKALPLVGLAASIALTAIAAPARAVDAQRDAPYALVRDDGKGVTMTGSGDDRDEVGRLRHQLKGEFLWFRDGGRDYVIQDPALLAKARAAWAPVDRLGAQMDAYGRDMDKQGKAMGELGQQMGRAAAGNQPDQQKMQAIQQQMNTLSRRMADLGNRMADATPAERDRLNQEMGALNGQMSDLGRQMGAATQADVQRQTRRSMDDTERRMNEAQKPMTVLGKKMDALGKDMERESHAADNTVRALIRDAMARGLAHPAPRG